MIPSTSSTNLIQGYFQLDHVTTNGERRTLGFIADTDPDSCDEPVTMLGTLMDGKTINSRKSVFKLIVEDMKEVFQTLFFTEGDGPRNTMELSYIPLHDFIAMNESDHGQTVFYAIGSHFIGLATTKENAVLLAGILNNINDVFGLNFEGQFIWNRDSYPSVQSSQNKFTLFGTSPELGLTFDFYDHFIDLSKNKMTFKTNDHGEVTLFLNEKTWLSQQLPYSFKKILIIDENGNEQFF